MEDIGKILSLAGIICNIIGILYTYRQFRYEGMWPRFDRFTTSSQRVLARLKLFARLASGDSARHSSRTRIGRQTGGQAAWDTPLPPIASRPDDFASETDRRLGVLIARVQEAEDLIYREERTRMHTVSALRSDMIRSGKMIAVSGLGAQLFGILLVLVGTVFGHS